MTEEDVVEEVSEENEPEAIEESSTISLFNINDEGCGGIIQLEYDIKDQFDSLSPVIDYNRVLIDETEATVVLNYPEHSGGKVSFEEGVTVLSLFKTVQGILHKLFNESKIISNQDGGVSLISFDNQYIKSISCTLDNMSIGKIEYDTKTKIIFVYIILNEDFVVFSSDSPQCAGKLYFNKTEEEVENLFSLVQLKPILAGTNILMSISGIETTFMLSEEHIFVTLRDIYTVSNNILTDEDDPKKDLSKIYIDSVTFDEVINTVSVILLED